MEKAEARTQDFENEPKSAIYAEKDMHVIFYEPIISRLISYWDSLMYYHYLLSLQASTILLCLIQEQIRKMMKDNV